MKTPHYCFEGIRVDKNIYEIKNNQLIIRDFNYFTDFQGFILQKLKLIKN